MRALLVLSCASVFMACVAYRPDEKDIDTIAVIPGGSFHAGKTPSEPRHHSEMATPLKKNGDGSLLSKNEIVEKSGQLLSTNRHNNRERFQLVAEDMSEPAAGECSEGHGPETAHWLNMIVGGHGLWPNIRNMAENIMKESVQPQLQGLLPSWMGLGDLQFTATDLGDQSPIFSNLLTCPTKQGGLKLIVHLSLKSNQEISLQASGTESVRVGIKDFSISGNLIIHLGEFIDKAPMVGGVAVYFVDPPDLDWELTGLARIGEYDHPKNLIRNIVSGIVSNIMVVPNVFTTQLSTDKKVEMRKLKTPPPLGIVKVTLKCAHNLPKLNSTIFHMGSSLTKATASDPYAIVKVGGGQWQSEVQKSASDPSWSSDNSDSFTIWSQQQAIDVAMWDKDLVSGDEFMGRYRITVRDALGGGASDKTFELTDKLGGQVLVDGEASTVTLGFQKYCMMPSESQWKKIMSSEGNDVLRAPRVSEGNDVLRIAVEKITLSGDKASNKEPLKVEAVFGLTTKTRSWTSLWTEPVEEWKNFADPKITQEYIERHEALEIPGVELLIKKLHQTGFSCQAIANRPSPTLSEGCQAIANALNPNIIEVAGVKEQLTAEIVQWALTPEENRMHDNVVVDETLWLPIKLIGERPLEEHTLKIMVKTQSGDILLSQEVQVGNMEETKMERTEHGFVVSENRFVNMGSSTITLRAGITRTYTGECQAAPTY